VSPDEQSVDDQPKVVRPPALKGREAFKTHLMLVVTLALCALAFWFELGRAERGNHLSWAYVFEWPLLAGFGIYMWWKFMHPETEAHPRPQKTAKVAPEYAGMLLAWEEEKRKLEEVARAEADAAASGTASDPERLTDQ